MAKVILYIAMSIDGYIADEDGGVAWLEGDESNQEDVGTYEHFIEGIETVIMGYSTYHQVTTKLAVDHWPYEGKKSYVLTHRPLESKADIIFIDEPVDSLINRLKTSEGDIWLCGGASIVNQALDHQLIDEFRIAVIPTILGKGIPLFNQTHMNVLTLIETHMYNGIVELVYKKRKIEESK